MGNSSGEMPARKMKIGQDSHSSLRRSVANQLSYCYILIYGTRQHRRDFRDIAMDNPINPDICNSVRELRNAQTIISEAVFGYRYVKPYLDGLSENSDVLEVGSGPCVLLSHICSERPKLNISGIEPIGPGFEEFRGSIAELNGKYHFEIFNGGYEDYPHGKQFDLIFSINVFEHLPDWRDFLRFVKNHLKAEGKCIILCPNYTFPYEPHFRLPIFFNGPLTYSIFRKQILNFEKNNSCEGLWSSLNFVTLGQVSREARLVQLRLASHTKILEDLIARLDTDEEFHKRQQILGSVARALKNVGLGKLITWKALKRIHPYMFLELSRFN